MISVTQDYALFCATILIPLTMKEINPVKFPRYRFVTECCIGGHLIPNTVCKTSGDHTMYKDSLELKLSEKRTFAYIGVDFLTLI